MMPVPAYGEMTNQREEAKLKKNYTTHARQECGITKQVKEAKGWLRRLLNYLYFGM